MEIKKVTSQIRQTSLKGVDAVVICRSKFGNHEFREGFGAIMDEQFYIIDKRKVEGRDTYFVGKQTGLDHFKQFWVDFAILYKDAVAGKTEFAVRRAFMDDNYGEPLQGLVKQINYELNHPNSGDWSKKQIYFVYNLNDYKDLLKQPVNFKPSMLTDYVKDMQETRKRQIEMGIEPMKLEARKTVRKTTRKTTAHKTVRKPTTRKTIRKTVRKTRRY